MSIIKAQHFNHRNLGMGILQWGKWKWLFYFCMSWPVH